VPDDQIESLPFLKFAEDSPEYKYMYERRNALGGILMQRRARRHRWRSRRSRPLKRC
jgi:pyruvate dehydrogenase E1 component